MGNVQASSSLPPMPPSTLPVPGTPQKILPEIVVKNPGCVEDIHKKCKDVFPISFDGLRLVINKGLSNHFYVSHSLLIGTSSQNSSYKFGSTFVGTNQIEAGEYSPLLIGDIDPRGNISTNLIVYPTNKIKIRVGSQFQEFKTANFQVSADYKTERSTSTVCLANPDFLNNSGSYITQSLYALNNSTSVGYELQHHRGPHIPGGSMTIFGLLGKYIYDEATTISSTVNNVSLQCCYHFKASEQLQFAVDLEANLIQRDVNATFGYAAQIPKSDISIKGSIDRKWNISMALEKRLNPMPFTFALSTNFCPLKHSLKMGCGFVVG
ncbi:mitochondrial import receptor subunit TOM40 homolog 2-like [Daktulosphaira vitifoliae]|uniref:mitochondrial import receptor subunit TOM40 homolog 2-like n=1 Tax=Daktulosphaira vitifoliae TaxID=58002 RepID=UPI0021AADDB1|nr:mitochondrial import receptor subunit TOM40 homolog 2-like [Daktulosphaira vitifoliae]